MKERLDYVHDLQKTFRKILRAFTFPGEVQDLRPEAEKLDEGLFPNRAVLLAALTLLDGEVTYHLHSPAAAEDTRALSGLTNGKPGPPEQADFLFSLGSAADFPSVLEKARIGDLVDPHRGATVIIETGSLTAGDREYLLSGPGISGTRAFRAEGIKSWLGIRGEKNREFPLGIDILLIGRDGRAAALPRTTRVAEGN